MRLLPLRKALVIHKMQKSENTIRRRLMTEHDSESSRNINFMDLSKSKFKTWVGRIKDRGTQNLMATMLTDTAFRLCGDRLFCPHCPDTTLNLAHIIKECPNLSQDRLSAQLYTNKVHRRERDYANTDLFINFCAASRRKMVRLLQEARAAHPSLRRPQDVHHH